jgi:hypothetical protein
MFNTNRCSYCGVKMVKGRKFYQPANAATRDHIVPTSRGGKNSVWAACCYACNGDKFNLTLAEWRAVLAVRYHTIPVFWFEREAIRAAIRLAVLRLSGVALYL